MNPNMSTVKEVTVIKIKPIIMTGKYKLGQYWPIEYRRIIANKIKMRNPNAIDTLRLMGFNERLEYISEPDW